MKIRFPLYAKILFWFFLNVLFLSVVLLFLARVQFHFGLDSLVAGPAGERIQAVTQAVGAELRDRPRDQWDTALKEFSDAYKVQFYLFRDQDQIAGTVIDLPQAVRDRLNEPRGLNPPPRQDGQRPFPEGPPFEGPGPRGDPPRPGPPVGRKFMVHTTSPNRYWVVSYLPMPMPMPEGPPPPRPGGAMMALIAASDSLSGGGLFFDLTTWVVAGVAVVVVSVLFWFPLVRGITHSISRMTAATERIAEGHFDERTQIRRQDELGLLGESINRMAVRLSGFVAGQKRFLGDIAHELCSPIARIQVALGILEQRADEKQKANLQDLREEVEQMSTLVNELLSFTKASLAGTAIKLQATPLRAVVEKAVSRECALAGDPQVKIEVAEDLRVMADPDLLLRATGNILRNALRYAAQAGPITITAAREGEWVKLCIEDCGPGIPEEAITQVFDPFYRVDTSRDRETGGVGLGLAIVKTCVESCGGTVYCENRAPTGLRVVVLLAQGQTPH
jgi:two-component system sensor histidine kinase CpxA